VSTFTPLNLAARATAAQGSAGLVHELSENRPSPILARSRSTPAEYVRAIAQFCHWCESHGLQFAFIGAVARLRLYRIQAVTDSWKAVLTSPKRET
jgi:hypothetical protein